jgi:hypothetical protein
VEPSSGALVLQRRCADEDGPRLHDILENLLVAAETWAARLASAPGAAAADKAARDRSGEPVPPRHGSAPGMSGLSLYGDFFKAASLAQSGAVRLAPARMTSSSTPARSAAGPFP